LLSRKSWSFDLRYLLGWPPWDTKVTLPEVVELVEGRSRFALENLGQV